MPKTSIEKIISGGQTGADQGGLLAAKELGIKTGGYIVRAYMTENGPAPWLAEYGLIELPDYNYPARTRKNVQESDATALFGRLTERGS